ncbi:MAG: DUF4296 domain-containing protein [Flavobacteriales bacterium]|nr:DUF4296 domain-containing protein [Flavobacteriales bacterium]
MVKKPDGLLDEKKMVQVLTDVELLEATFTSQFQRNDTSRAQLAPHYQEIFSKHKVTQEAFEKSFSWYSTKPDRMQVIRSQVYDELSKMQVELTKKNDLPDSLLQKEDTTMGRKKITPGFKSDEKPKPSGR